MDFKARVDAVKRYVSRYPGVKIVAATKYLDVAGTKKIVEAGMRCLGENRAEIFLKKWEALRDYDIEWHFFGELQTRKVKDVANKIDYLHSLGEFAVAAELEKRLAQPLNCFVQVNIASDPKKYGVPVSHLKNFIKQISVFKKIKVIGLMCIAKMTYDEEELRREFLKMRELQKEVQEMHLAFAPCAKLSMGMTNDYKIALECGSTTLRLGRIFLT